MKHHEKPTTSSSPESQKVTKETNKPHDSDKKIDRPGVDLGGSSGETHAGTGLGLGNDASDTSGDRRLPGRRPDKKPSSRET